MNQGCGASPRSEETRAVGVGARALEVLSAVSSTRAHGYLHSLTTDLEPWKDNTNVSELIGRARSELAAA